jgi:ribosome-associated translation inhibitor RaiA
MVENEPVPFELVTRGPVNEEEERYLVDRFERMEESFGRPVTFTRVKVTVIDHGRHRARPVNASATNDLDGLLLRAHVGAAAVSEAVDQLLDRLRRQLERHTPDRAHEPAGRPAPDGEWRHGFLPTERPDFFDRPVEERELVRHKSYGPEESTVEEAVWDLAALDYDFFLFKELTTGEDCLLARREDGLDLHRLEVGSEVPTDDAPVGVVETGAPRLEVEEAIERLDSGDEHFVFFRNAMTSRGNVLYRRYDGHYGLITPPDQE